MQTGQLNVIAGCMWAGKTEALIHSVRLALSFDVAVTVFKPTIDTRYADSLVHSHSGQSIKAELLAPDASNLPMGVGFIAIDEAQFLLSDAIPRILDAVKSGTRVLVAGLDLDASGRPFGPMPVLMAFATSVQKLAATCAKCSGPATRSHRLIRSDATILVGGSETYEPRCVGCFDPRGGL